MVPRAQSDALVAALRSRSAPVEYALGQGEGHGFQKRETRVALFARVARFLEENAAPRPAPTAAKD